MIEKEEYENALKIVLAYREQLKQELIEVQFHVNGKGHLKDLKGITPDSSIYDLRGKCSVRLVNLLRANADQFNIDIDNFPCSELSKISKSKFTKCRGVGHTTCHELTQLCNAIGIELQP